MLLVGRLRTMLIGGVLPLAVGCGAQTSPPPTPNRLTSAFVSQLTLGDVRERADSARRLGELGADALSAVPSLMSALSDESDIVRVAAAHALLQLDPENAEAPVKILVEILLKRESEDAAHQAALALDEFNREHPGVAKAAIVEARNGAESGAFKSHMVQDLVVQLNDPDPELREAAAIGLGQMGTIAAPAASALVEKLNDPGQKVRFAACDALWHIGPASLPALETALDDDRRMVQIGSASALLWLGPQVVSEDVWAEVIRITRSDFNPRRLGDFVPPLRSGKVTERRHAALVLGTFPEHAKFAVPDLKEAGKADDAQLRFNVAWALKRIGEGPTQER
jgi:HEAT repeat protein